MCAGIAIGALAVLVIAVATAAEVASGGLATPVIIALVALGASGVATLGSAGMLAYKSHDCDYSLQSDWLHFHPTVNLNGEKALLHNSLLKCNKGGMVSIFLDDTLAQEAANEISKNNSEEVSDHETSQFFEGLITGVTSLTGIGLCIGLTFSIYDYQSDENEMEEGEAKYAEQQYEKPKKSNGFETDGYGEALEKRGEKFGMQDVPAGAAGDMGYTYAKEGGEGVQEYFTKGAYKGEGEEFMGKGLIGSLKSLFIGAVGAAVAVAIDTHSNEDEAEAFNDSIKQALKARADDLDTQNDTGVFANQ